MTAATGAACAVPIIWETGSGFPMVWFRGLYLSLGFGERSRPSYSSAYRKLRQGSSRMCNAAEKQLLLTLPGVSPCLPDTLVVSIKAACQWLRRIGQLRAAEQLCQHQQPVAAAARRGAAPPGLAAMTPASGVANADDANTRSLLSEHDTCEANPEAGQDTTLRRTGRKRKMVRSCRRFASLSLVNAIFQRCTAFLSACLCLTLNVHCTCNHICLHSVQVIAACFYEPFLFNSLALLAGRSLCCRASTDTPQAAPRRWRASRQRLCQPHVNPILSKVPLQIRLQPDDVFISCHWAVDLVEHYAQ